MKTRLHWFLLIAVFSSAGLTLPASSIWASADHKPELYLGAAKTDITPPIGTPLSGYGKRKGRPSTSVHDPLWARAISLQSTKGNPVVILSLDLVLIDEKLRAEVLRKINLTIPLRSENLLMTATHNHSGAGAIGGRFWERFIMGKFRKSVFQQLTDSAAQAAVLALENKVKVSVEYGETPIREWIENRLDEKILPEHKIKMLRFRSGERVRAQIIFMAAHPTLFHDRYAFSADYPGVITRLLDEQHPDSVAMLINGAAADLRPRTSSFPDSPDRSLAYGFAISEVIKKMNFEAVEIRTPLQAVMEVVKLPKTQVRAGFLKVPSLVGNRFFPRKAIFQGLRFGSFVILTFPGELGSEISREIEVRAAAYRLHFFLAGFANDYITYAIPERYYRDRSQYEAQVSFYGPQLDWFTQNQSDVLLQKLLTDEERGIFDKPGARSETQGIPTLRLYGSPYHRGFEEGRLLKQEIKEETDQIFKYLRDQLPIPLANRLLINASLDKSWKKLRPYVSYNEYQQMKGIADGSGIPLKRILRLHALPEVYPTWCSNGAYWGPATLDGKLIAIRNLDWNRDIGVHKYPAVKFHEMNGMNTYANIGYAGFAGTLSGINEKGISVGQIGSTSSDETMEGVPMYFLLKRILETARGVEDAKNLFSSSYLTRGYNYVIADALGKEALSVEATARHLRFFKDDDAAEKQISYAVPLKHAVIRSDTALDPTIRDLQMCSKGNPKKPGLEPPGGSAHEIRYLKHAELVKEYYGRITPEIAQEIAKSIAPKSNIQSVVYAFPEFYVANMKDHQKAAESGYVKFTMADRP